MIPSQLVLALFPGIFASLNENYRCYNFQAFADISGNLQKIARNIKFTEISQPE